MKQERVLVTGAGGFVGRSLASGFADLGWQVIGLDRAFAAESEDDGVRRVTAELTEGVPAEVSEVDVVVHAAWVTTDAGTLGITRADHIALNLRPLLAMLEYAAEARPAAFVFLSSSGVFAPGDAPGGLTDADQPTGASPYAAAKLAGEVLVRAALDRATAVHVVRLGYLFGPGEAASPSRTGVSLVASWLAAARAGQPLTVRSDDPRRDWTFISDLARALERVVKGPPAGNPVHLGSPHVSRDSEFARLIASHVPGATTVGRPATGSVKAPMVPSVIPALDGFEWTDPTTEIEALLAAGALT